MARLAETDEVSPDLFRGIDRQRVTSGIIFEAADQDADHLALQVQKRRAGFSALGRQIDAQMRRRKIPPQIFSIEAGDHAETGRLGQIKRVTDGDNRCRDFELFGFSDRQRRRRDIYF